MISNKKRVVLFDVGGTLIRPKPRVGEVYAQAGRKYGLIASSDDVHRVFRLKFSRREREAALITPETEKEWWRELVASVVNEFGGVSDFESYFEEVSLHFSRPGAWYVFPDVFPTLLKLRERNIVMGIVSNWDSRLEPLCEMLGLSRYMDVVIVSAFAGSAKPDRAIFDDALRQLHATAAETIHIGDSVEMDWHGAGNAGIDALIVDRDGAKQDDGVTVIGSLDEVLCFLGSDHENCPL